MAIRLLFSFPSVFTLFFVALQSAASSSFTMEFKKLHSGIDCHCIDKHCKVDVSSFYCRRLLGPELTEVDFQSYLEMGRKPAKTKESDCNYMCEFRAISVQIYKDDETLLKVYKATRAFKANTKNYYCKINFTNKCGKVKHTISSNDDNHYSFFKSDDFELSQMRVEIKEYQ